MDEKSLPEIRIQCDRPSHVYRMGENAAFEISTPEPGTEVEVIFTSDGEAEFELYREAVQEVFREIAGYASGGEAAIRKALQGPEAHTTFARLVK